MLGEEARRREYLRRVRHLARVDDEGEAVGVQRRLERRVKVAARQMRPHRTLVILESVPRGVGGGRATRGSLDLRGGGQAPGGNSIS